jgi:hypothetical protein
MSKTGGAGAISRAPRPSGRRHVLGLVATALLAGCQLPGGGVESNDSSPSDVDQELAGWVLTAQRADGLFVFSVQDTQPPVIAETYFAVGALAALGVPVPRIEVLDATLMAFSSARVGELSQGKATMDPRDLYEVTMIQSMLNIAGGSSLIDAYLPRLTATAARRDRVLSHLRDWYFAARTLIATGHLNAVIAAAVSATVRAQLPAAATLAAGEASIGTALLVDTAMSTGGQLSPSDRELALQTAGLAGAPASWKPDPSSDMLGVFYGTVMAIELGARSALASNAIMAWLQGRRHGKSYAMARGQPVTALATFYGS